MAARLIWSETALRDLEQLASYIAADSPHWAEATLARIIATAEKATAFPASGRVVPEYDDPDVREVLWRHYRIIYAIGAGELVVLTVIHGARRLPEAPPRAPED